MSWSFKIGRVFGIGLYVHFTFLLLLAFLGFAAYSVSGSTQGALNQVGFVLILFGIVMLHELGHALAARHYGIPTKDITLLPIGGLARLERIPRDPVKELVIAIAGPAVNVILALAIVVAMVAVYGVTPWAEDAYLGGSLLNGLFQINVALIVFNMIPAFPMDGGRVLRSILAMLMSHGRATRIAAGIGQGLALMFALVGFFGIPGFMGANPMLMLIALFVWSGAAQEAAMVTAMEQFAGATVRRAMMTRFETLAPNDPIGWAAQQAMTGAQKDFPVLHEGELIGVLSRSDVREAMRHDELDLPVGELMRPVGKTLTPEEPLERAMERIQEDRTPFVPVVEEGHLVGLVTVENLHEYLAMRRFQAERREEPRAWPRRNDSEIFSRN